MLDGSSRLGILLSVYRRVQRIPEALHQVSGILHNKPTHLRHDTLYPGGTLFPLKPLHLILFNVHHQLLMEQRHYAHIPTYVYKGEAALEAITGSRVAAANAAQASAISNPNARPVAREKAVAERDRTQTKLDVALAMSYLAQGQYEKAAQSFMKVGSPEGLEGWAGAVSKFI